jgi:RimJ/RimL family protein N-acetyltransferase
MSDHIALAEHERWFEGYADKSNDFVFVLELPGRLVGQLSVYNINNQNGTAEVGRFLMCPSARGHGYMSRGCACLIEWCRDTLKLQELRLEVKAENAPAIRLYKRLGFKNRSEVGGFVSMSRGLQQ